MEFPLDDDWGPSTSGQGYPALDIKQNVSRTVQKKRRKAALDALKMSVKALGPQNTGIALLNDVCWEMPCKLSA